MKLEEQISKLAKHPWVKSLADGLGKAAQTLFRDSGGPIEDALHGVWLGHPLHPALTDIPIGAWSVAVLLDAAEVVTDNRGFGAAADLTIGVGVAGAVSAAAAGLADWSRLGEGEAKRVGAVHAALNTAATGLYLASLASRKGGARGLGRLLAVAGFAVAGASAYLGGHLVFAKRIGVDHAAGEKAPEKFTSIMPEAELMEGELRRVEVDGAQILLVRHDGRIHALSDVCSHLGCSLAQGHLEGDSVRCDCHGSRFALEDGQVLDGPSTYYQPVLQTRIYGGQIQVGKRKHA